MIDGPAMSYQAVDMLLSRWPADAAVAGELWRYVLTAPTSVLTAMSSHAGDSLDSADARARHSTHIAPETPSATAR